VVTAAKEFELAVVSKRVNGVLLNPNAESVTVTWSVSRVELLVVCVVGLSVTVNVLPVLVKTPDPAEVSVTVPEKVPLEFVNATTIEAVELPLRFADNWAVNV
jgi:hypothetical protein